MRASFRKIAFFLLLVGLLVRCDDRRVKRRVLFSKNSKMFFRLNGKDNVIPWVQIFAQGWAVRVNWDLPDTLYRRHRFFKRDIHNEIENLNGPELGAYSCILNYICEQIDRISTSKKCGILCGIGNIIKSSNGNDADFFMSLVSRCDYYKMLCIESHNKNKYIFG